MDAASARRSAPLMPTTSVVIPAYNAAGTIVAAIRSALAQTLPALEILVIDDGSTDDTEAAVRPFGERVRWIRQAHGGPGAARNRGVAEAQGEWVAFLDADDLWLPRKLEIQRETLRRVPEADAVQCSAYLVNDALEVIEARWCRPDQNTLLDALSFRNLPALSSTLLVRKRCLEAVGGFSTDQPEEAWDLAVRLLPHTKLTSVAEALVLYRQHPGNRSRDMRIFGASGLRTLSRVFADPTLEASVRTRETEVWARFYAMLAGGYFQQGEWRESLRWGWRAMITSPRVWAYMAGMPLRRVARMFTVQRRRSFAKQFASADSSVEARAADRQTERRASWP